MFAIYFYGLDTWNSNDVPDNPKETIHWFDKWIDSQKGTDSLI